MLVILRSIVFNFLFFTTLILGLLLGVPLRFFDKKYTFAFWKYLSLVLSFITRNVAGITEKLENRHFLLEEPAIYAIRHESMWETIILIHLFKSPIFILKKELCDLPLFGTMAKKVGSIAVDRDNGVRALISAAKQVEDAIKEGHPVIIFPEGTRSPAGQHVPIKRGIALFYKKLNCKVVPVVHNAGNCWARRGFIKKPGIITVKFCEPILPGLDQDSFMEKLNYTFRTEIENLKSLEG